jgi:hypothetical protein
MLIIIYRQRFSKAPLKKDTFFTICKDSQKLLKSTLAAKQYEEAWSQLERRVHRSAHTRVEISSSSYLQQSGVGSQC